jgi:hypothetical protein
VGAEIGGETVVSAMDEVPALAVVAALANHRNTRRRRAARENRTVCPQS